MKKKKMLNHLNDSSQTETSVTVTYELLLRIDETAA